MPAGAQYPAVTIGPYFIVKVQSTTPVPCALPGGAMASFVVGIKNNSATAQSATVLLVEPSGNVLDTIGPLGPGQILTYPPPGLGPLSAGVTATASAAITGDSILILVR